MIHLPSLVGRNAGGGTITRAAVWGGLIHVDLDNNGWLRVTLRELRNSFGAAVVTAVRNDYATSPQSTLQPLDERG